MKLLIVIVNYKSVDLTTDCLASLQPQLTDVPGARVAVVDNASNDGSVELLTGIANARGWNEWLTFRALPSNDGFAAGNNAAIDRALKSDDPPDYVILLNPDTIVREGAIRTLVDFLDANPKVGIAGSRLEDPDGTPQRSAFRFHSVASELESGLRIGYVSKLLEKSVVAPPPPEGICQTDWVAGACMIVRRSVFDAVGLMDEGYFMYFEEVDFCLRARHAGWSTWYVPTARVVHLIGQTSGVTDVKSAPRRRPPYWFASRRRYFRKNHGLAKTVLADLAWAIGFSMHKLRSVVQRQPSKDAPRLLSDFLRYNFLPVRR